MTLLLLIAGLLAAYAECTGPQFRWPGAADGWTENVPW